jgi:hypothetical protein
VVLDVHRIGDTCSTTAVAGETERVCGRVSEGTGTMGTS